MKKFSVYVQNIYRSRARLLKGSKEREKAAFVWLIPALLAHVSIWVFLRVPGSYLWVTKYHVFSGTLQVGDAQDLFFFAKIGLFFLVLGYVLVFFYIKRERTLAYLIIAGSFLVQISFLLSVFLLRFVNGL